MKTLNLFMAITVALVTTFIILSILFFFEESNLGWGTLLFVSTVGYSASGLYFYNYKHSRKDIG